MPTATSTPKLFSIVTFQRQRTSAKAKWAPWILHHAAAMDRQADAKQRLASERVRDRDYSHATLELRTLPYKLVPIREGK